MRFSSLLSVAILPCVLGASARSNARDTRGIGCINTTSSRTCWGDGFDIFTKYYEDARNTGLVREYWFNIENTTASPNGVEMPVQLINGSFPGPTIIADWGDTVGNRIIRIFMSRLGTVFLEGSALTGRQLLTNDVDLGHLLLKDWYHNTADNLILQAGTSGPRTAPNGLINGTNIWEDKGSHWETTFPAGVKYRLRFVNAAADQHFRFIIDNHTLEVIANDFVPIVPYNTTQLSICVGQRYDIIVTAKRSTSGNFWLRAIPPTSCSESSATDKVKGIIRYDAASSADPTTSAYNYTDSCEDESQSDLVPYVALNASDTYAYGTCENFEVQVTDNGLLWLMNKTTFRTQWEYPTLLQVAFSSATWLETQRVIHLPGADEWVYMVIHSPFAQAHPMHLHGHDFWVLGSGNGRFDLSMRESLTLVNAPRRDVVMLPASGYVVIAIKTNNPGVWLMHCHIAWHTSEGFPVQILERAREIEYDYATLNATCRNWQKYVAVDDVTQYDSGV